MDIDEGSTFLKDYLVGHHPISIRDSDMIVSRGIDALIATRYWKSPSDDVTAVTPR